MSKLFFMAAALIAANSASAASYDMQEACGKLKVEKRVCITAPCFQGFKLVSRGESLALDLQGNEGLNNSLSKRNGQDVCVVGMPLGNGAFAVFTVTK